MYFRNLQLNKPSKNKWNELAVQEIEGYLENNTAKKFEVVYFINRTHFPYEFKECADVIIEKITQLIKNNKQSAGYYAKYVKYKTKYTNLKHNNP